MNVWGTESRGYHIFGRTLLTAVLAVFFLGHTVSANESVTIKVGLYQNPPKIYREKDGSIQGFWPQLLDHMAENNGWKIEYVPCKWAGCLELLKNGGIDLMPDVAYTQKRAQLFDFSNPTVFVSWSIIYAGEGIDIETIFDLKGKKIAVLKENINHIGKSGISALLENFDLDCSFIEKESYEGVFRSIEEGQAHAGVVNIHFGSFNEGRFHVIRPPIIFQPIDISFAFPKAPHQNADIIQKINTDLTALKNDRNSIYYHLLQKYIQKNEKPRVPPWTKPLLIAAGCIVLFLLTVYIASKRQVARKTEQLRTELAVREMTERELFESKEKYRELVTEINDGIFATDNDGVFTFSNDLHAKMLGFGTKMEITGGCVTNIS